MDCRVQAGKDGGGGLPGLPGEGAQPEGGGDLPGPGEGGLGQGGQGRGQARQAGTGQCQLELYAEHI